MKCPLCDVTMRPVQRRGVEIDICPECRGVWLDRGELDKILASSDAWESDFDRSETRYNEPHRKHEGYGKHEGYEKYERYGKPHKKKSLFKELFDFDFGD